MRIAHLYIPILALLLLLGCDDSNVPTCDELTFEATGGDLVGRWEMTAACVNLDGFVLNDKDCPEHTYSLTQIPNNYIEEFRIDGTRSQAGSISGTVAEHVPRSCGDTCSELRTQYAEDGGTCVESVDACDCRSETEPNSDHRGVLWKVEGNALFMKGSNEGWGSGRDYAVHPDYYVSKRSILGITAYNIYERQ